MTTNESNGSVNDGERLPWQMTRREWESARESNKPEHFGSSTKYGGSLALSRIVRLQFLLDGAKAQDSRGEPRHLTHGHVIAHAIDRGDAVSAEVLADYSTDELEAYRAEVVDEYTFTPRATEAKS